MYIAAWTAFSVVTLQTIFGNYVWLWLWLTAVGVAAIAVTAAHYKRKFAGRRRPGAVVAA